MKLTDPEELDHLLFGGKVDEHGAVSGNGAKMNGKRGGRSSSNTGKSGQSAAGKWRENGEGITYVPLTEERIEFLVRLTDPVHKPV